MLINILPNVAANTAGIQPRRASLLRKSTGMILVIFASGRFVKELMHKADMSIREDPMGNIWGRWAGSDNNAGVSYLSVWK